MEQILRHKVKGYLTGYKINDKGNAHAPAAPQSHGKHEPEDDHEAERVQNGPEEAQDVFYVFALEVPPGQLKYQVPIAENMQDKIHAFFQYLQDLHFSRLYALSP